MKKALATMTAALLFPVFALAAPLDSQQKDEVKQLVRETLMENPEILVEVINELKKKEGQQQAKVQGSTLKKNYKELFSNKNDPFAGPANAKVSLVYFGDMNCGYCKRQDPVLEQIVKQYPDLRIIYKDLPILRPSSREAAAVALAAFRQKSESYLPLHKRLMANQESLTPESIAASAKAEGLNIEQLKKNIDASINQQLDNNIRLAQELGIKGTPALVFEDEILGGYTEQAALAVAIEKRLNKK